MGKRLTNAAVWMAPSFGAAAVVTAILAAYDALDAGNHALDAVLATGFTLGVAFPAAAVFSMMVRGLYVPWRPAALLRSVTQPNGSAPRLLGWSIAVAVALALIGVLANVSVWGFSRYTAFKPRSLAYALPIVIVVVVALVVAVTPSVACVLGNVAERLERVLARRTGAAVLTPRRIGLGLAAVTIAALVATLVLIVRPRFENVDFHEPYLLVALVVGLLLTHGAWTLAARWQRPRRVVAVSIVAGCVLAIAGAALARVADPSRVLSIWGRGGTASDAIELLFDLYAIRDDVPRKALVPKSRPGAAHPDILLITIDTFRPDRMTVYGGPVAVPTMAALSNEGSTFDWAIATSNVTRRSLPSLITGLVPPRVIGRVVGWALRLDPRHVTLAERLRAGGYRTTGLLCCDGFWGPERKLGLGRGIDDLLIEHSGAKLAAAYSARAATRTPGGSPLFTWIHIIELHTWAEGGNTARTRYDSLLAQVDGFLGTIRAANEQLPASRRPIVIITGDHGEALGDHHQPFHSTDLYNSQIRIPLIVAGPGIARRRIEEVVSLADLAPTILDLAGFEPPTFPEMDGHSLAGLVRGSDVLPRPGSAYAVMMKDRYVKQGRAALIEDAWKLIEQDGRYELYDLKTDPGELTDLANTEVSRRDQLIERLRVRRQKDAVRAF